MSDSDTPPPAETHEVVFSGCLTTYEKSQAKSKKETKKTKTKEFKFSVSNNNYLELLRACLESHGIERYQVSAKRIFGFKYLYPMSKPYVILSLCCTATKLLQNPWRSRRRQWEGLSEHGYHVLGGDPNESSNYFRHERCAEKMSRHSAYQKYIQFRFCTSDRTPYRPLAITKIVNPTRMRQWVHSKIPMNDSIN